MRRLRVEMPLEDFIRLKGGEGAFYRSLESFVVLQILRAGPRGASSIVQIRPKDPRVGFAELTRGIPATTQLLDQDGRTFTCLMKFRPMASLAHHFGLSRETGYIVPPMEVEGDRARLTFVGSAKEVTSVLSALRGMGLRYRVSSISDFRLSPSSPLNSLTDKQRRVVSAAYQHGYYDRPRRVSSEALAKRLGIASSTLVNHRLKAERRLLSVILGRDAAARGAPLG